MKIKLVIILIFAFTSKSFCRVGIGDWQVKTPYENEINNSNGLSIYLKNNTKLDNIYKWYFYKDCIVGVLGYLKTADSSEINGYFIINEKSMEIRTFKTEKEWKNILLKENLSPKIITRWFDDDWKLFDDSILLIFLLTFYISIPLLLLFLILYYFALKKSIKKEKFNLLKPNTIFVVIIPSIIILKLLLENFPQSI